MFGKWHLGGRPGTEPGEQGFSTTDSMSPPGNGQFKQTNDPKWIYRITEGACAFMEANRDRPFCLYVAHHATHMGIQAREDLYARFEAKGPGALHRHVRYAAMNAQMDDGVGRLLAKLEELGLERDTLVFFTSDNGGLPQSPQTPLRGFKGMYYEGGIRVPMVARMPGTIEAGSTCDVPVHNVDLFPTFLAAAGAGAPAGKILDGESLLPLLKGTGPLKRQAIFWHFPGYLDRANPGARDPAFRTRPVTVIRKGDWKLHLFHEEWVLDGGRAAVSRNNALELYNLAEDPSETANLASTREDKRDELLDDLLAWLAAIAAPMPTEANPNYDPDAPPANRRRGG
jgi:arylsulfatase A-like enzyme